MSVAYASPCMTRLPPCSLPFAFWVASWSAWCVRAKTEALSERFALWAPSRMHRFELRTTRQAQTARGFGSQIGTDGTVRITTAVW